jgi:hypothetical protein
MSKTQKRTPAPQTKTHPVEEHFSASPVKRTFGKGISKELAARLGVPVDKQQ